MTTNKKEKRKGTKTRQKKNNSSKDPNDQIIKRLDALIRILLETMYDKKKKYNDSVAVKTLHSAGLSPTEIAKILGKKGGAHSVSTYLYSKPKTKKKRKKSKEDDGVENE